MRTCGIVGCDRDHHARGMCHYHYERWNYGLELQPAPQPERFVCECTDPVTDGVGQCLACYRPVELLRDNERTPFAELLAAMIERQETSR